MREEVAGKAVYKDSMWRLSILNELEKQKVDFEENKLLSQYQFIAV